MEWKIKVSETHPHVIRSESDNARIAAADTLLSHEEATAIASRLVKCWNACTGMADPAAEIEKLREDLASLTGASQEVLTYMDLCGEGRP